MRLLYTLGILCYTVGVRLSALFGHRKARQMVRGWREWPARLQQLTGDAPVAWFHASSLGEFEQARPVIEQYHTLHPQHRVLLTFFSPSGYEVRSQYAQADAVCYLPPDLPWHVRRFVKAAKPSVVFFVKYDHWYNYLRALRPRPVYLFSAIFRENQYFFRPWGRWFMRQLRECYTHIFVQDVASMRLLQRHGAEHVSVAGDTRFDRVRQIAAEAEPDAVAEAFVRGVEKVIVCGSTWPPDEDLLAQLRTEARLILAPHVISEEHLLAIERLFPDSIRYSRFEAGARHRVLIVDNIGLLSRLYRYGTVAYIGGGFGVGIHNTLEAAAFGCPVLFGPHYEKFREAHDLIAFGGGFAHSDLASLQANADALLHHPERRAAASAACLDLMNRNVGSTSTILALCEK